MDHLEFHQILKKYLRGEANDEERELIDRWYANMGKDKGTFLRGNDEGPLRNRYWMGIRKAMSRTPRKPGRSLQWFSLGLAASALLLAVSYFTIPQGRPATQLPQEQEESSLVIYKGVVNRGDRPDEVILPDGSKVLLEPKSRIRFAPSFDGPERIVHLEGKAFFDVVRDENRPFKVHTQKLITRVLGTSFVVTAFRDRKESSVSVKTGKVSVFTRKEGEDSTSPEEVILTPNQEFVYDKEEERGKRLIVEEPQAIVPPEVMKRMRFEEASPRIIFEAIEKVYGVDIVFDEEKFSSCKITTSISEGNIFNRIHIMCEVMNARYRVEDARIIIEGEGCRSPM